MVGSHGGKSSLLALARLDLDAESLDKQPDGLQHVLSGLFVDEVGTLPLLNHVVVTLAVSAEHALGTTDVPKLQSVAMGGSDVSDEMLLGNSCALVNNSVVKHDDDPNNNRNNNVRLNKQHQTTSNNSQGVGLTRGSARGGASCHRRTRWSGW